MLVSLHREGCGVVSLEALLLAEVFAQHPLCLSLTVHFL